MAKAGWIEVTYFGGWKDGEKALLDEKDLSDYADADKPYRDGYYLRDVEGRWFLTQNKDLDHVA